MPQQPQFELKEGGVFLEGERIANYTESAGLRMLKGQGEHKEAVKEFLGLNEEEEEESPKNKPLTADQIAGIAQGAAMATVRKTKEPVCPFPGEIDAGDKDPKVVEWWYENHPELAEKKYAGRRLINPYA